MKTMDNGVIRDMTLAEEAAYLAATDTLADVKQRVITKIEVKRRLDEQGTVQFAGNTFAANDEARSRLLFVLTAYGDNTLPVGYTWPDVNDVEITMNFAQLRNLAKEIASVGKTISANARSKRNAVVAATTIAEVEAIEAQIT